jgi:probable F420-dependent oxidoreductase
VKFTVEYPIEHGPYAAGFLDPDVLIRFAQEAEAAGFDAIAFSEHPAPSRKWVATGGHDTFDPLAALAFCAAATTRIRLMTHLLVLPYHNPPQVAKTLATVDVLSGGRLVVAAGVGYLRSEYAAVGVDFDERNALFDEAVAAIDAAWSGEPYSFRGTHFHAVDQVLRPRPVQQPRPPLWIGGNSPLSRRRVVRYGQGWSPMLTAPGTAGVFRSTAMESLDQLADAVDDLTTRFREAGRDPATLEVQLVAPSAAEPGGPGEPGSPGGGGSSMAATAEHVEQLRRYAKAGVTSTFVRVTGESTDAALAAVWDYGTQVIAPGR